VKGNHNRHGLSPKAGDGLATAVAMWPTPMTVNRTSDKAKHHRPTSGPQRGGPSYGLEDAVLLWPTPVAHDDGKTPQAHLAMKARMPGGPRHAITSLTVAIKAMEQGMWPTPQARDGDGRAAQASRVGDPDRHGGYNLDDWVRKWNTPRSSGASLSGGSNSRKTAIRDGSYISGSLNPAWVEALMGFPPDWTATAGPPRPARRTRGSRPAPSPPAPSPPAASA
jgi:hypothetical protein